MGGGLSRDGEGRFPGGSPGRRRTTNNSNPGSPNIAAGLGGRNAGVGRVSSTSSSGNPGEELNRGGGGPPGIPANHPMHRIMRLMAAPVADPPDEPTRRHWCHQCDDRVSLDANSCCSLCGGGFVEQLPPPMALGGGAVAGGDPSAQGLLAVMAAMNQLSRVTEEMTAAQQGNPGDPQPTQQAQQQRNASPGNRRPGPTAVRIEDLLRELQGHLRVAEGVRSAMRVAVEEQDVVGTTSYRGSQREESTFTPLREEVKKKLQVITDPETCSAELAFLKDDFDDASCAICCCAMEPENAKTEPLCKLPRCCHLFHRDCVEEWFKRSSNCPICRRDLNELAEMPTSGGAASSSSSARP